VLSLQEALAEEQRMAARYANDIDISKSQRDYELKKAAYDQEVQAKKAQSELAYNLQVCSSHLTWHLTSFTEI
jgi:flotillin